MTGANLEAFPDAVDPEMNGKLIWEILEEYNDAVRRSSGREKGVPGDRLAHLMPKDSRYYYDMSHFTNAGAAEAAALMAPELMPVLRRMASAR